MILRRGTCGGGRGGERGGFGWARVDGSLSVAAFWAGAAHPRRQKIGKCRLRAHQHPLSPPLPNLRRARSIQNIQVKTRRQRVMERVLGDLLLPASILDFKPKLENRCKDFLVSGLLRALILKFKPRLENRCKLFPVYTLQRASILDFRPRLENRCSAISATVRNGFAFYGRSGNDVRVRF